MDRWSKIVLSLAATMSLGWIGGGVLGFRIADDETLAQHTLFAFVSLLGLILVHGWIAVFTTVSVSLVRRRVAGAAGAIGELMSSRRAAVGGAGLAVFAATAQFVVANALYPGRLSPSWHAVAGGLSALAVVSALVVEARALARHGRAIRELARGAA